MAYPSIIRTSLRIAAEAANFLLQEDAPRCVPVSSLASENILSQTGPPSGLIDRALSYVADSFDISLPRVVTIYNESPIATAYLFKIIEVIPAELVLFFFICGVIFCAGAALLLSILIVFCSCFLFARYTNPVIHENRADAIHEPLPALPRSPERLPLSDTAQFLIPTVHANENHPTYRRRSHNSRSSPTLTG